MSRDTTPAIYPTAPSTPSTVNYTVFSNIGGTGGTAGSGTGVPDLLIGTPLMELGTPRATPLTVVNSPTDTISACIDTACIAWERERGETERDREAKRETETDRERQRKRRREFWLLFFFFYTVLYKCDSVHIYLYVYLQHYKPYASIALQCSIYFAMLLILQTLLSSVFYRYWILPNFWKLFFFNIYWLHTVPINKGCSIPSIIYPWYQYHNRRTFWYPCVAIHSISYT